MSDAPNATDTSTPTEGQEDHIETPPSEAGTPNPASQEGGEGKEEQGSRYRSTRSKDDAADLDKRVSAIVNTAMAPILKKLGLEEPEKAPPSPAEEALRARVEADLETLSKEDRELVDAMAGDDIVQQAKVYTALLRGGKISAGSGKPDESSSESTDTTDNQAASSDPPAAPPKRIDMNPAGETSPDDWKSAGAAVARAVRDMRF